MASTCRGIRIPLPTGHETRCDGVAFVDGALRHRGLIDAARGLGDVGQRHHRGAGQLIAGRLVVDVQQRWVTPDRRQHRQPRLNVDADVAAVDRQRERFGRRQTVPEPTVDQQPPHVTEGDPVGDQVLDVHAAVAQRAAVLVGFGDLCLERHHARQPGSEILRHRSHAPILAPAPGVALSRGYF